MAQLTLRGAPFSQDKDKDDASPVLNFGAYNETVMQALSNAVLEPFRSGVLANHLGLPVIKKVRASCNAACNAACNACAPV